MQVSTIGFDLAKRVFQVHGVDAAGRVVLRRKLQRAEVAGFFANLAPCLVGVEACATAHHWARLIEMSGHQVRLMPPSYVRPYVRRSKTDAADAEAICEAVGRPNMRFVPVKSAAQQAALLHHRARDLLVRQRTMLINALRGHLSEFGIIVPTGRHPITASAIAATIADPSTFRSGRELAAWIGLVPRQHSSGGKPKLGRVSKQGDRYLRRLLTVGATSVMRRLPGKTDGHSAWIRALLGRRPFRLASLALANKMARITWAVMVRQEDYRKPRMAAAA
jgi:transposase